jgi:hypothetical protein
MFDRLWRVYFHSSLYVCRSEAEQKLASTVAGVLVHTLFGVLHFWRLTKWASLEDLMAKIVGVRPSLLSSFLLLSW